MSVLEGMPEVRVRRGGGEAVKPHAAPTSQGRAKAKAKAVVRVRLVTVRSLWGGPEQYEPAGDEVVIGSQGDIALAGEKFSAPKEAVVSYRAGKVSLIDLEGGNRGFVRTRHPVELVFGDAFLVGDQMLCPFANPPAAD